MEGTGPLLSNEEREELTADAAPMPDSRSQNPDAEPMSGEADAGPTLDDGIGPTQDDDAEPPLPPPKSFDCAVLHAFQIAMNLHPLLPRNPAACIILQDDGWNLERHLGYCARDPDELATRLRAHHYSLVKDINRVARIAYDGCPDDVRDTVVGALRALVFPPTATRGLEPFEPQ